MTTGRWGAAARAAVRAADCGDRLSLAASCAVTGLALLAVVALRPDVLLPGGRAADAVAGAVVLAAGVWSATLGARRPLPPTFLVLLVLGATLVCANAFEPVVLTWSSISAAASVPVTATLFLPARRVALVGALCVAGQVLSIARTGAQADDLVQGATVVVLSTTVPVVFAAVLLHRLAAVRRELETAATTDQLTGLANRRGLAQRAGDLVRRAATGGVLAVAVVDVDHFKSVNDRHGHEVGDAVLVGVAAALRSCARGEDLLVRWGGEEIAWVAHLPDAATAARTAERMRRAVAAAHRDDLPATTASLGLATADLTGARDDTAGTVVQDLLAAADTALYAAKRAGRDRVVTAARAAPLPVPSPRRQVPAAPRIGG